MSRADLLLKSTGHQLKMILISYESKVSLYLIKHYDIKTFGGRGV
jgi:hypothetical protein